MFKATISQIEASMAKGNRPLPNSTSDAATNSPEGRVALQRFIQKASLIRAPHIVEWVEEKVSSGFQVAVSVEFLDSLHLISEGLATRGVSVTTIYGAQDLAEKEANRLAFQRDEANVVVFTISEGISLHAEDSTVNGSDSPRVLCIADPRWSAIKSHQIEGRTSRDGHTAETYYSFAVETREEVVISRLFQRVANQRAMVGDREDEFFSELTLELLAKG